VPSEHAKRCADSRRILDSGAGLLDLFSMLTFLLHSTTHRLLGVALLVVSSIQVEAVDVLVRAKARADYVRPTDAEGRPIAEQYIFHEGKYYAAEYEADEEAIRFKEVAFALKKELRKRRYIMAEENSQAEIILIVHWGQTNPASDEDDPSLSIEYSSFDSETGEVDSDMLMDFGSSLETDRLLRTNAEIIGAMDLYDMHVYSMRRRQLEEASLLDRYFVNLVALSIEEIRNRPESKVMPEPIWTMQLSLPAGRTRPELAFASLAETAGRFSGEELRNAFFIRDDEQKAIVRIGELEFIESLPTDSKSD
jgi:hypothetical protein